MKILGKFLLGATLLGQLFLLAVLYGCSDPVRNHSLLSSLFDGVPDLPSVNALCRDHMDELCKQCDNGKPIRMAANSSNKGKSRRGGSKHKPYAEDHCGDCHEVESNNRLLKPKEQLCFMCHRDLLDHRHLHGPAAVGACTVCHLPHESSNPALLRKSLGQICISCHIEERLAQVMHERVIEHDMFCFDCHDPHGSNLRFFLK